MQEMWVQSLGQEDPFEAEMTTCSSILVWEIPWTEEPGGLQSIGTQRDMTWVYTYMCWVMCFLLTLSFHHYKIPLSGTVHLMKSLGGVWVDIWDGISTQAVCSEHLYRPPSTSLHWPRQQIDLPGSTRFRTSFSAMSAWFTECRWLT